MPAVVKDYSQSLQNPKDAANHSSQPARLHAVNGNSPSKILKMQHMPNQISDTQLYF
jgi:hypothetical protein